MAKQRTYVAIDLKSFYASVESRERYLDPLTTNLVVADLSRTGENILAAVIAAATVVLILITFGYENTKLWFKSPLVWHDPDTVYVQVVEKYEYDGDIVMTLSVSNLSNQRITFYRLYAAYGMNLLSIIPAAHSVLPPHDGDLITTVISKDGSDERFFRAVKDRNASKLKKELSFHVMELQAGGETVYKANTWIKPVLLLVISLICGILVFGGVVRSQGLRIVMKVLCIPVILVGVIVLAFLGNIESGDPAERQHRLDADVRKRAAERYKEHARDRANALMGGSARDAARVQGQMDKLLADMLQDTGRD